MRDRYDVIVVGARVAGSTLAALLGAAGVSVLLLDRARFPSTTPSTHFFRGAGMVGVLERLGVLDAVLALGAPPLARELNYSDGGAEPAEGPPQDPGTVGYCLSVRRAPLDFLLLQRALAEDSVDVAQRASVVDLLWDGERVTGVQLADGGRRARRSSSVRTAAIRWLRARSRPRSSSRRRRSERSTTAISPASRAPAAAAPDAAEFSLLGDEIAYVFPSDAGLTCVAVSVNLDTFARLRRDLDAGYAERIDRHRGLAPRVAAAEPAGRLAGCGPERSYVRVPHGPGWALVGDAGMHQDPWSGEGMDMAGVHATFLAEAVVGSLNGDADALPGYHRRRDAHGLATYEETVGYAADLSALSR